jgi:hypothetical protein
VSRRNVIWLAAIVLVGAVLWIVAGWLWGLLGALATLVLSEVVERSRRSRIRAARGDDATHTGVRDVLKQRRR